MKDSLHPNYTAEATITCACGNTFKAGSTMPEIYSELCSNCHPFYTGKQKLLDTTGSVDRFHKLRKVATEKQATKVEKKPRKTRVKKMSI